MTSIPKHLQDAKTLLSENGFATGDTWYHGTSSALLASIKGQGLKRSGDKALNEAASKTMATIGNNYAESVEPVFLTQSKELAYYWAQQTVRDRSVRFEGEEQPIVLAVNLSEKQRAKVRPDVGAMSLLMMSVGEKFMANMAKVYQENNIAGPDIELRTADRMDYLNKLGMAYIDEDISRACVQELAEPNISEPELSEPALS
ncbi:hypothetical protein [Vibrio crassostreae]|uniref:hypothetical protein n=1 Tax=Vibrio crassostreae TaxID=246167 RepID=UPI00104C09A5|nr:hypothetical protein [Vibrio crassostreae]TCN94276.1 hypothetical protein EDB51_12070 [Vibrio crassostreae]CAK1817019.1 conserved hypothetical protein [Vibrio crassostreae]CAK1878499.1 conserved hypothetical protein [Vibrio crassostreae]CAK1893201.1 conserved hypothetical protein [Vibrio crassostreae]CAK2614590.1 conserved hypothetical protein [Vibrio crassostreae]